MPRLVSRFDKSGMLKTLERTPDMYRDAQRVAQSVVESAPGKLGDGKIDQVVFLGMGGSAIAGDLVAAWSHAHQDARMHVHRDYGAPRWVDKATLAFALSYSGETAETLDASLRCLAGGCRFVGVSSGGLLEALCRRRSLPHVKIPAGLPPRAALPYLLTPPLLVLEALGLAGGASRELRRAVSGLESLRARLSPEKPERENAAKRIARGLLGTFPAVYGYGELTPAAYRWKTQLNENSKVPCRFAVMPELFHNEVEGWGGLSREEAKASSAVILRMPKGFEPPKLTAKIDLLERLVKAKGGKAFTAVAPGASRLARMLAAVYLGDYTSVYLALLRGVDPTPVRTIARLRATVGR